MSKIASDRLAAREDERGILTYFERVRPTTRAVQPQYWTHLHSQVTGVTGIPGGAGCVNVPSGSGGFHVTLS